MPTRNGELALECKRQAENCLYTSTTLFIWLRFLRYVKAFCLGVPLVLGSLATWDLLTTSNLESVRRLAAISAFVAGLLPTLYAALRYDQYLEQCTVLASRFKSLQDRFRKAARVSVRK